MTSNCLNTSKFSLFITHVNTQTNNIYGQHFHFIEESVIFVVLLNGVCCRQMYLKRSQSSSKQLPVVLLHMGSALTPPPEPYTP